MRRGGGGGWLVCLEKRVQGSGDGLVRRRDKGTGRWEMGEVGG